MSRVLESERLLTAKEARHFLGGISEMCEWRWRRQFEDFPTPIRINGRKYYRANDLRTWLSSRQAAA